MRGLRDGNFSHAISEASCTRPFCPGEVKFEMFGELKLILRRALLFLDRGCPCDTFFNYAAWMILI